MLRLIGKKLFLGTRFEGPIRRFLSVPFRIRLVNFIFQRIFRINGDVPWSVYYTSIVLNAEKIKIGRGVARSFAVSGHCYVQGYNGIEIGDDAFFAPGVKILSANHNKRDFNLEKAPPIQIGTHCWIGANAVILAGVTLGNNVIVGAGAVVTKSFPDNCVIGGVPARVIKKSDVS